MNEPGLQLDYAEVLAAVTTSLENYYEDELHQFDQLTDLEREAHKLTSVFVDFAEKFLSAPR